jgi:hypothetical protein
MISSTTTISISEKPRRARAPGEAFPVDEAALVSEAARVFAFAWIMPLAMGVLRCIGPISSR